MPNTVSPTEGLSIIVVHFRDIQELPSGPPLYTTDQESNPEQPGSDKKLIQPELIAHNVFLKSFCKSQLPHKSANLSFTITNIKNKLTDLCGNRLLQNDSQKQKCMISARIG